MVDSIYWYDLETYGIHPGFDRIAQFAGIRTDLDLNPIDEPLVIYCQCTADYLPDPNACLVSLLVPNEVNKKALNEPDFIKEIHAQFSRPGTCVAGYNNIRFDDEFIRFTLYRNFYDAYAREWKNGNSRWDILDALRMSRALRPEGIQWPYHKDGSPSMKLEDLAKENGIEHSHAHDALSDVEATIGMAKLLKNEQPKLYEYLYQMRLKSSVTNLIKPLGKEPIIHVSAKIGGATLSCAVMLPIARHPTNANAIICVDLSDDTAQLMHLSVEEIRTRVFTSKEELGDVERINLKLIHLNKCPAIAPIKTLSKARAVQIGIDINRCRYHLEQLISESYLPRKLQAVFEPLDRSHQQDSELALYSGGFINDIDKVRMETVRNTPIEQLDSLSVNFSEARLTDLFLRYRARHNFSALSRDERSYWLEYCVNKLFISKGIRSSEQTLFEHFQEQIDRLTGQAENSILRQLSQYGSDIKEKFRNSQ